MTQEDKELLLKDLCARLPYGVKFPWRYLDIDDEGQDEEVNVIADVKNIGTDGMIECGYKEVEGSDFCYISEIKPYLRPLSSMTEEEIEEYFRQRMLGTINVINPQHCCNNSICAVVDGEYIRYWYEELVALNTFDLLNANHLDYRGLIPMGLALPASEGMYKI